MHEVLDTLVRGCAQIPEIILEIKGDQVMAVAQRIWCAIRLHVKVRNNLAVGRCVTL